MPQIPVFENDVTVRAPGAARASPEAFAAPWRALAAGAADISNEAASFQERYAAAKRQADAANAVADVTKQLSQAQFQWSQTPDRDAAMAGFAADAEKIRDTTLKGIKDPQIAAHVTERFASESASRWHEVGNQAFALESSKRRGDLDTNLTTFATAAATANDPMTRAQTVANGIANIRGAVAGGWLAPEAGAKAEIKFRSDIDEAGARHALNAALDAPDLEAGADMAAHVARAVSDPSQFPDLSPERREILAGQALTMSERQSRRAAAKTAHADVIAERDLKRAQASNETTMLVDIHAGRAPSGASIERLAANGQLSAEGVRAIYGAIDRKEDGRDAPVPAAHLWQAIGDGHASYGDVYAAFGRGEVSKGTQTEMVKAIGARTDKGTNAVERGAFGQLKTALSGSAVEQGLDIFGARKAERTALWVQAQGEWNRRVVSGGEDSGAVLNDMLPRYTATLDIPAPTWLPAPRFGAIASPEDMEAVRQKLRDAYVNKAIAPSDFEAEAQLLNQYKQFYDLKAAEGAAAVSKAKPPAGKK